MSRFPGDSREAFVALTGALILCFAGFVVADDRANLEHFEKKIRPVLVEACYDCHSAAAKEVKGGLLVDFREGLRQGGESGPAVVPGNVADSPLIAALRHDGLQMPPKKKLSPAVVADFVTWIEQGAVDPREKPASPKQAEEAAQTAQYDQRRQWWSLQPVTNPPAPDVRNAQWPADEIDRFILARLERAELAPAGPSDRATLARRLSFALTGLPPAAEDVEGFLADPAPDGWERLVDRWLASPHFGERWARHWMDVVRYTDTYGYEWDIPAKGAWRYRDYLVRALNADVPFDQLIREQIAGDLLPSPRINPQEQINESRIGPMFFQMGEKRHGDSSEFDGIHQEMLDNKVDAFSKAFLATTLACARCHEHKLDAVHQSEYYAIGGAFISSRWVTNTVDLPERHAVIRQQLRDIKQELRPLLAQQWRRDLETPVAGVLREKCKGLGDKEPPLEDPLSIWSTLQKADEKSVPIGETWVMLCQKYQQEQAERRKKNADHFTLIADFRNGVPAGWSVDGVGLAEITACGDFTVELAGDNAVGQILAGGLFTFADSPRLNGAVRTPILNTLEPGHLSFEVCGGDFASRRGVIDNAFLTEKQQYLNQKHVAWQLVDTFGGMRQRHIYLEYATKTSNPNFPPRVGLGGACSEEQAADPKSWFGITRVMRHTAPFTPVDDLTLVQRLLEGAAPQSLDDLSQKYAAVGRAAIEKWRAGQADFEDVRLINWLVDQGLLKNSLALLSPKTGSDPDSGQSQQGIRELVDRYRMVERQIPLPWTVNGMADLDPGFDLPLLVRGEYDKAADCVARGYLQSLGGTPGGFQVSGSGRRELAEQIASPANPLTSRVFGNRVWHWLFGTGIVATPNDFGHAGDLPSHPELLDKLAADLVNHGWSSKRLVRQIVCSQTWRQANQTTAEALAVDPGNRLLHYYPLRRLEAEAIRDAILAASGRLDDALYGPPINPPRQKEDPEKRLFSGPLDGLGRRSIYTKLTIMEPPKFLAVFNQPPPKIPAGARDNANTPAQALTLLNDPLVKQQAEVWAARLIGVESQPEARIQVMFLTALGRAPSSIEMARWTKAARDLAELQGISAQDLMTNVQVWTDLAHAMFNTKEFLYGL